MLTGRKTQASRRRRRNSIETFFLILGGGLGYFVFRIRVLNEVNSRQSFWNSGLEIEWE